MAESHHLCRRHEKDSIASPSLKLDSDFAGILPFCTSYGKFGDYSCRGGNLIALVLLLTQFLVSAGLPNKKVKPMQGPTHTQTPDKNLIFESKKILNCRKYLLWKRT